MKKALVVAGMIAGLIAGAAAANADVHVRGGFRSNGSYVGSHYRSNPDGNRFNNWSTSGNYNPRTGSIGTRSPYGPSNLMSNSTRGNDMLGRSWGSTRLY